MSRSRDDEIRRAERAYEIALTELRKVRLGKSSVGSEAAYGEAYQQLVRLGIRPQLRLKYRR